MGLFFLLALLWVYPIVVAVIGVLTTDGEVTRSWRTGTNHASAVAVRYGGMNPNGDGTISTT